MCEAADIFNYILVKFYWGVYKWGTNCPLMKHFFPDGSDLFQDDSTPIYRTQELTECFDEFENDVNYMLSYVHLWEIMEMC